MSEHKLFIGMLPKGASKADVMAVFSPYGTIKELSVIKGSQPTSKGEVHPFALNFELSNDAFCLVLIMYSQLSPLSLRAIATIMKKTLSILSRGCCRFSRTGHWAGATSFYSCR